LVARTIHAYGPNSQKPFLPVDCGSLVPTLIESELFGYVKGAFTGANRSKDGLLVSAEGGTVFLDEIGELSLDLQAKLLRALQEKEVRPVGATHRIPIKARIVAATNRDLAVMVEKGTFRKDLFYRLNVVNLRLPALRERPGDIAALADHFAKKYAKANGLPDRSISIQARQRLVSHRWPGNVRELENAMHRAVLLSTGAEVEEFAIRLPDGAPMPASPAAETARAASIAAESVSRAYVGQTVAAVEQQLIIDTLSHCFGNRTHAANILGISIRTLRNKLKEYSDAGVSVPPPQQGQASAA
jgi:DNA-binding NtrC family response regulator